jgi:acetyl esterase/lipase
MNLRNLLLDLDSKESIPKIMTQDEEKPMSKAQRDAIAAQLRAFPFDLEQTVEDHRRGFDEFAIVPIPEHIATEETVLGGRPALELTPPRAGEGTLLCVHGGGFVVGSHLTGADLAWRLAERAGQQAFSLDYRLAPEHPFPAAVLDGVAAYRELLERGTGADRLVIAGDSAGGGLVVSTLIAARDAGLPMPAAAYLISPLTDQTHSGASIHELDGVDPLFVPAALDWYGPKYVGEADPADPLVSPLFADLRGLPPLLIQVGAHELLLDDSIGLARAAAIADVDVTLEIGAELTHVYQKRVGKLDEADAALDRAAAFLGARLAVPRAA